MASYRVYCLTSGGDLGLADWIEAATDEEAIEKGRRLRPKAHKCEIWLNKRLVGRLNDAGHFERVTP